MPTPAEIREAVAKAIYGTHLPKTRAQLSMLDRGVVSWEDASDAVRKWVLKQADSAIAAHTPLLRAQLTEGRPFDDEIPEF